MSGIQTLPEEVLEKILILLSLKELLNIRESSGRRLLPRLWGQLATKRLDQVRFALLDSEGLAAYYEGAALGEYQLEDMSPNSKHSEDVDNSVVNRATPPVTILHGDNAIEGFVDT